jgi:hypothetical protein
MEGFGEAAPPQDLCFLVVVSGFAGNHHQKEMILGGLAALQTSLRGRPRNSCQYQAKRSYLGGTAALQTVG